MPCDRGRAYLGQHLGPLPGGAAVSLLEMAGQMALVGEPAGERHIGERRALADQRTCPVEAPHDQITVGTGAEAATKLPREVITREPGHGFQFGRADAVAKSGIEEFARTG